MEGPRVNSVTAVIVAITVVHPDLPETVLLLPEGAPEATQDTSGVVTLPFLHPRFNWRSMEQAAICLSLGRMRLAGWRNTSNGGILEVDGPIPGFRATLYTEKPRFFAKDGSEISPS